MKEIYIYNILLILVSLDKTNNIIQNEIVKRRNGSKNTKIRLKIQRINP